jgi:hypothetical protein
LPPFPPPAPARRIATKPARATLAAGALTTLVVLALALGGCSSSGSSQPKAGPSGDQVGGAQPVASTVVLGRVAGNIHQPGKHVFKQHRKAVLRDVGAAVDSWIDGGFVGVDYPRAGFAQAFAAFTAPARKDAERQQALMTNWTLRQKIDGVVVKKRKVVVDVLAPKGRPAGATARVDLVFSTTGDTQRRVEVSGRLFLTPDGKRWRIFGYDVARGGAR